MTIPISELSPTEMSRAWSLPSLTEPLHPLPPPHSPTGPMSADGSLERALIPATCEEEDKKEEREEAARGRTSRGSLPP